MMRFIQPVLIVLPIVPFLILVMLGYQSLGFLIITVLIVVGLVGVAVNSPHYESWLSLITSLIISVASQGYLPYVMHITLIALQNPGLFNASVLAPEYSLTLSYLYRSYNKYAREFRTKGFDNVEVNRELNMMIKHTLAILTTALLITAVLYYLIIEASIPIIDPFTALVIFTVAYLIIFRYVMARIRS